jgi:hypothetical protein
MVRMVDAGASLRTVSESMKARGFHVSHTAVKEIVSRARTHKAAGLEPRAFPAFTDSTPLGLPCLVAILLETTHIPGALVAGH